MSLGDDETVQESYRRRMAHHADAFRVISGQLKPFVLDIAHRPAMKPGEALHRGHVIQLFEQVIEFSDMNAHGARNYADFRMFLDYFADVRKFATSRIFLSATLREHLAVLLILLGNDQRMRPAIDVAKVKQTAEFFEHLAQEAARNSKLL